jgi:NAD(P)H-dependent FMN reductase
MRLRVLGISGSLRRVSLNTAVLNAMAALAPKGVEVAVYGSLEALPAFNPDRENDPIDAVADFRTRLQEADGILFSTPEYAHALPGAFKNAIDWVIGTGELVEKPVALVNPSPRSTYAQDSLREILATVSAHLVPEACVTVPLTGRTLPPEGIPADGEIAAPLRDALDRFAEAIAKAKLQGQ